MRIVLIAFLTYILMLLLKLNLISTIIVGTFLFAMHFIHAKKKLNIDLQKKRFEDVALYIDTLLYSFLKERKIIRAFEDVYNTLEDGQMRETVSRALDHMMLTFDETEVLVDSMKIIEDEYPCSRLKNVHEFMAHSEYYGGDIEESAKILLRDKNAWERRIKKTIDQRQRMFRDIVMSVAVSIIISGIILYLPILNMDISTNIFVQILAVVLVVLDDIVILLGQRYLEVDYLSIDLLEDDDKQINKLKEYKEYDARKAIKMSLLLAILPTAAAGYFIYIGHKWYAAAAIGVALVMINQHKIGHRLMKKNLLMQIKSAFPKWLMDLALLIQSENVQVAIKKSREHIPAILDEEAALLTDRLDLDPESSVPYHRFLECLKLPEINAAMGMLYAVSIGNSANSGKQIEELITKNLEMLDTADTARLNDKTAGMYLLFLAPVVTASFKMIVDMAVFLISFLAYRVV